MKEEKNNFTSDDLQRTMEVPSVSGSKEPSGGIYDPWKLNGDSVPDSVIEYIAKKLSESEKMPEEIEFVPLEREEPEVNPLPEETPPEPAIEETVVLPEEEIKSSPQVQEKADVDATKLIKAVAPAETPKPEYEASEEKEIFRKKAAGGRLWPPVLISSILLIVACFITLTAGIMPVIMQHGFARGMTQIMSPVINVGEPPAFTNVLLVGVDKDGYRTDTMMVATYDNDLDKVSIMQLPRDTYVHNNGRVDKKLNSAYFSGIDQLKYEVQIAYGIETHKYVEINLEGFRKMIDAIGGVEMNVPINMIYDDPYQNFHIYLLKGVQVLDGDKAEQFVRFRKNNDGSGYPRGDLQRMEAQKEFIMATVEQMISIDGLSNINELIKIAQENVKTDLTFDEIYNYCTAILTAEEPNIYFIDTPGEATNLPGGSYFVVDYDQAREVAQTYFYATQETMAKMKRIVVQPVTQPQPETSEQTVQEDNDDEPVSQPQTGSGSAVTRDDEDEPSADDTDGDTTGAMSR